MKGIRGSARSAVIGFAVLAATPLWAQSSSVTTTGTRIYSCVDAQGKRLTSDRPIPECVAREQRLLNADGSVRRVVPPTLTASERAEAESREIEAAAERVAKQDMIRRDRSLVARFPNEAAHRRARDVALDDIRGAVRSSEARVKTLTTERQPLLDESQFYVGKPMPAKLKSQLDSNEAAQAAQRQLIQNQEAEILRIDALYDAELARLRKLWAGAPAGSLDSATLGASMAVAAPSGKPVAR